MADRKTFQPPSRSVAAPAKPSPLAPRWAQAPPGAVQRVIRKHEGADPYTSIEEVVADYPGEGGVPTVLARSILTHLLASGSIDVDASKLRSWEAIARAYEHLTEGPASVGSKATGEQEEKAAEKDTPPSRGVTRDDLESLVDEDYMPSMFGTSLPEVQVLKLKGWSGVTWEAGKIFYTETADSPIVPFPPETVNAYWDLKYPSPFARVSGPYWGANCADHAIGRSLEDVDAAIAFLASTYTNRGSYNSSLSLTGILNGLADGIYVVQVGLRNSHFIRVTLTGTSAFLSQKDQESGVYEATMSKAQAGVYIHDKSGSGIVYQAP